MTRRIALISEHASPLAALGGVDSGGQNVYVGQIARGLARAGYRVDLFTRREAPDQPETLDWADGVRIVHVPAGPAARLPKEALLPHMPEFAEFVTDFALRAGGYDLVHANFWMSGLVAAELKRTLGIPFVITFHALGRVRRQHQGDADSFPDERFAIEERITAEADAIIAECPQDEEDLTRLYGADPAKISVVPCGFDRSELWPVDRARARQRLGLDPEERIVLQLGRMVPRKGVDNAIRGFARLVRERGVPARLLVVGGEAREPDPALTPEIGRLQAVAAAEGVAGLVTFTGSRSREELRDYYSAADVFVTTPWYEPFGITPVEAMACGTPVIGANVGGIKATVADGETGFLVPPDDPAALAERLAHLFTTPGLLPRLSRQALQRANERYTWASVTAAVAALYERTLTERPSRQSSRAAELALIDRTFADAIDALEASRRALRPAILAAAAAIARTFQRGGTVLLCGNGGSAADAQHFAAEFVGRFKQPGRAGLPAIALCADSAFLTAWANDTGYDDVFARGVEAFGRPGDLLIGISTSGRSRNVVRALETARRRGLETLALAGGDGGDLRPLGDTAIVVPSADTQHIQEVHIVVIHLLCDLVEAALTGRTALTVNGALVNGVAAEVGG